MLTVWLINWGCRGLRYCCRRNRILTCRNSDLNSLKKNCLKCLGMPGSITDISRSSRERICRGRSPYNKLRNKSFLPIDLIMCRGKILSTHHFNRWVKICNTWGETVKWTKVLQLLQWTILMAIYGHSSQPRHIGKDSRIKNTSNLSTLSPEKKSNTYPT